MGAPLILSVLLASSPAEPSPTPAPAPTIVTPSEPAAPEPAAPEPEESPAPAPTHEGPLATSPLSAGATSPAGSEGDVVAPRIVAPFGAGGSGVVEIDTRPHRPPPKHRGTGMFVAAGIVGAAGGILKLIGTYSAIMDVNNPFACTGRCGVIQVRRWSTVGTPLLAASAGLLGGGMAMRGRVRAHDDRFHDLPEDQQPNPRMPIMAGLGWGLLGGGVGLWAVTRPAFLYGCKSETCIVAGWETTYYVSGALILAGAVLGPYATAHRSYTKRLGREAKGEAKAVSLAPSLAPGYGGLSLAGRF
jgi:hypothetical protein